MLQDFSSNDLISDMKAIDLLVLGKNLQDIDMEYRDNLSLPRIVRFGVELEYEGVPKDKTDEFIKNNKLNWSSKIDETLKSGGEIVSPKLIDEKKTWENLRAICEFLKRNNADTCHNAGLHVHVGAHILGENYAAWRKLAKLYVAYERVLMRFGYGDKLNARSSLWNYAKPVGLQLLNSIDSLSDNSPHSLKSFFKQVYDSKTNAINLRSIEFMQFIVPFNTLEFRNFNSTTEHVVVQNDINTSCKLLMATTDRNLDEDFLDYKIKKIQEAKLTEKEYLAQCGQILLREMAELVDLIFENNQDKVYFMKQYLKGFDSSNSSVGVMARRLVK